MNAQRREGKRAPPDPPILADAKGGRRTKIEGKQREPAWDAGLMDEERTRCRIQSGVNSKQSILTIKRKEAKEKITPRDGWQMANPTGQKVVYVKGNG